ncbi:MAG: hypothetical protein LIQ31_15325 [Planctomycetes bacterium]|nr:hypothetical protein [Planctomycetota bacterium]
MFSKKSLALAAMFAFALCAVQPIQAGERYYSPLQLAQPENDANNTSLSVWNQPSRAPSGGVRGVNRGLALYFAQPETDTNSLTQQNTWDMPSMSSSGSNRPYALELSQPMNDSNNRMEWTSPINDF